MIPAAVAHPNARLETFCDGVFALALTLLIIEIKAPHLPHDATSAALWAELKRLLPSIFAFVLSFGIILITWVNHHQAMRVVAKTSMPFIYANGFMLLTVVFMPFPTAGIRRIGALRDSPSGCRTSPWGSTRCLRSPRAGSRMSSRER